ncbi:sensor histidine kinase [Petrotoga olearia]|uniref:sensor histidine kinase n=1 Tax=Petrotoga olearia TaxID=156203 RepID=UPI0011B5C235|nr:ATP-binding protein [Petrotoga olearia]
MRKRREENAHQRFKNEIAKSININIKNPVDDFLLHQLNSYIKNLEEKYKSEKYKRRNIFSILDTLSEGIILVSFNQNEIIRVDFANSFAKNIFTTENFVGRSLTEVIDNHNLIELTLKSFKTNKDMEEETSFYYPEKKYFRCQVKSINVENYRVIILLDITKEKNLEDLRREFLTIMSHEMRTPLSVISGYLETILHEPNLDEEIYQPLKKIEEEISRLTRMFNDLLDIERLEKNIGEEKRFVFFNFSNTVKRAFDFFKIVADKMSIEFEEEIEDDLYVFGNEDRLLQVVYNILDNSFKFTALKEKGEKKVWLRLYKNDNNIILEIEDTGIGIPSKELKRIFDLFYRVDKSRSRQVPGLGIGLYIVKTILDNHNARIYLDSEENNGTLFQVILPLKTKGETF